MASCLLCVQIQVVLVPIPNSKMTPEQMDAMMAKADDLEAALKAAGLRTTSDRRVNYTPGWKYNYWELKVRGGGYVHVWFCFGRCGCGLFGSRGAFALKMLFWVV